MIKRNRRLTSTAAGLVIAAVVALPAGGAWSGQNASGQGREIQNNPTV